MPSCFGTKPGREERSVLLVTTRVLLMQSINAPSKAQQSFLCSGYSSLLRSTILKSSHSGSLLERILWRTQRLVMTTRNLLTLAYRYVGTFHDHHICTGSCIPSSQLPRSKHSEKV